MAFHEYRPAAALADYIDAYWVRETAAGAGVSRRRVYADGCTDIILNIGVSVAFYNPLARVDEPLLIQPGRMYLAGTMSAYGVMSSEGESVFAGIRFKPGGFFALYRMNVEDSVDRILFFDEPELFLLLGQMNIGGLDSYFLKKADAPGVRTVAGRDFVEMYTIVYRRKGQITVDELAREWHVSNRTLERIFKQTVGISPKEFLRIVRFREVLRCLGENEESLMRVAFEMGYYDHAHLTHEFIRYAGVRPSAHIAWQHYKKV
jgi:AraC-like DNA-binding protein